MRKIPSREEEKHLPLPVQMEHGKGTREGGRGSTRLRRILVTVGLLCSPFRTQVWGP